MLRTSTTKVLLALALITGGVRQVQADPGIFQHVLQSTAWIVNEQDNGDISWGSGVLVDLDNRLVLTNFHVVAEPDKGVDADVFKVFFTAYEEDGQLVKERKKYRSNFDTLRQLQIAAYGRVVALNERADLALVQLEHLPVEAQSIALAEESATPGSHVHSVGNPGVCDSMWVYTPGEVRQVCRAKHSFDNGQEMDAWFIETTSPTNSGDSGGPIVNDDAELIGLVSSSRGSGRLVSHGIDINEIRHTLDWFYGQ